ncbi:N-acetylmuramoyl-L-alanine amidase [Candidatus Fermentibacteria bacterium]|nr:MAG: N-acetylmuramoyl-L-alanine amidase [Candidatus Fermentibacteria bacterium]
MKKTEWLRQLGYDEVAQRITESEAVKFSEPVNVPDTAKMDNISRIVVHHSATSTGNAELFRLLHRAVNRWEDLGYHFVIGNGTESPDGCVEEGRKLPYQGAHARGANRNSIGVCLVGNFNDTEPTSSQLESLRTLLRRLMKNYNIGIDGITLHRMVKGSSTECPGKNLTLEKILLLLEK